MHEKSEKTKLTFCVGAVLLTPIIIRQFRNHHHTRRRKKIQLITLTEIEVSRESAAMLYHCLDWQKNNNNMYVGTHGKLRYVSAVLSRFVSLM